MVGAQPPHCGEVLGIASRPQPPHCAEVWDTRTGSSLPTVGEAARLRHPTIILLMPSQPSVLLEPPIPLPGSLERRRYPASSRPRSRPDSSG